MGQRRVIPATIVAGGVAVQLTADRRRASIEVSGDPVLRDVGDLSSLGRKSIELAVPRLSAVTTPRNRLTRVGRAARDPGLRHQHRHGSFVDGDGHAERQFDVDPEGA